MIFNSSGEVSTKTIKQMLTKALFGLKPNRAIFNVISLAGAAQQSLHTVVTAQVSLCCAAEFVLHHFATLLHI